jgi:hypothetical protein
MSGHFHVEKRFLAQLEALDSKITGQGCAVIP